MPPCLGFLKFTGWPLEQPWRWSWWESFLVAAYLFQRGPCCCPWPRARRFTWAAFFLSNCRLGSSASVTPCSVGASAFGSPGHPSPRGEGPASSRPFDPFAHGLLRVAFLV